MERASNDSTAAVDVLLCFLLLEVWRGCWCQQCNQQQRVPGRLYFCLLAQWVVVLFADEWLSVCTLKDLFVVNSIFMCRVIVYLLSSLSVNTIHSAKMEKADDYVKFFVSPDNICSLHCFLITWNFTLCIVKQSNPKTFGSPCSKQE